MTHILEETITITLKEYEALVACKEALQVLYDKHKDLIEVTDED